MTFPDRRIMILLSIMPLFGLQDRVQACRGHRHGSGPPQLDPICSHNINRRSMKFCIQLQYSNTQGISSRFFEVWKKSLLFLLFKTQQKTMESLMKIANKLFPHCGQTIERSLVRFRIRLQCSNTQDYLPRFFVVRKKVAIFYL